MSDSATSRWSTRQLLPPTLVFLSRTLLRRSRRRRRPRAPTSARLAGYQSGDHVEVDGPAATFDRCSSTVLPPPRRPCAPWIRNQRVVVVRPADRTTATFRLAPRSVDVSCEHRVHRPGPVRRRRPRHHQSYDRRTHRVNHRPDRFDAPHHAPSFDRSGFTYLFGLRLRADDGLRFRPDHRRTVAL